jgi:hypothetical protein
LNEVWQLEDESEHAMDIKRNEPVKIGVLIKWKGHPTFENTWESADRASKEFPRFLLEDKEIFEGGGIDSFERVYKRKQGNNNVESQSSNVENQNSNAIDQNSNIENQNLITDLVG